MLLTRLGSQPPARRAQYRCLFALLQETLTRFMSMNARQDAVQLLKAGILDHHLSFSAGAVLEGHFGAQALAELGFKPANVGITGRHDVGRFRLLQPPDEGLGVPHGQSALRDEVSHFNLLTTIGKAEEGARVAHFDFPIANQGFDLIRQFQQAQQIGYRCSGAADGIGRFLVRQIEVAHQTLERPRFFQWIEIFSLNVLNQRHRDRGVIRNVPNDDRNRF